jgi:hypothetical protein
VIAFGIIVVVIAALLGAGAADSSSAPTVEAPPDNCYVCKQIEAWWGSLPWYRILYSWLWYTINHLACLAKGCR